MRFSTTIQFKNGDQAPAVTQEPGDSAAALVGALRLETRRSVILVAGGAEDGGNPAGEREQAHRNIPGAFGSADSSMRSSPNTMTPS